MQSSVYWIHHPEHTDMFTQGYIGVSKDLKRRLSSHRARPSNLHMKNAITKYGWDTLIKEVMVIASKEYCLDVEIKLRPADKIGWNVVLGGGNPPSTLGKKFKHTDEAKEKNRQAHLGKKTSEETKRKLSASHKKIASATRFVKGQSPYNKGVPCTPEKVALLRGYRLGKPSPRKGVILSQDIRDKISASKMGTKLTQEHKNKVSKANLGRKHSVVVCPHCQKSGGVTSMPRWHFDNCKYKENI